MKQDHTSRSSSKGRLLWWAMAAVATLFGVATLKSGGEVLFGSDAARAAAGNYVPFVVWFNFLAGAAYVIAGVALGWRAKWAPGLAAAIAVATALIFVALGVHIATGGAYETRTLAAMALRTSVWIAIAFGARRTQPQQSRGGPSRDSDA
jgi:hypothetical protein